MQELGLVADMAVVLLAALAGGLVAQRLRQPSIVGYLLAGVAVGPALLGLVRDPEVIGVLAEIGVVLLMFVLGVEFSLEQLRQVRRIALYGTTMQILGVTAVGLGAGAALGLPLSQAAFLGAVLALSSTTIVLKVLIDRGDLDALHGRIMLGMLLAQDLAVVPLMVILPALAEPPAVVGGRLLLAVVESAVFLGLMLVVGPRWIPPLMARVAALGSRDLFLLTALAISLGMAVGTSLAGLSLALGAFVAGLVISESALAHDVLADLVPLRDTFATLFFVSIGMLVQPTFIAENWPAFLVVVAIALVAKGFISGGIVRLFGYGGRTPLIVGLGLGQVGEFGLVLAGLGAQRGLIPGEIYSLTLTAALVTILATPLLLNAEPAIERMLRKVDFLRAWLAERPSIFVPAEARRLVNHVVICGGGRVGRTLAAVLERREFSFLIIDLDPAVIADLRQRGITCIYGDTANRRVLELANLPRARVLVSALPDPLATRETIRNARGLNPRLNVVARVHRDTDIVTLRKLGVAEVVQPEFEASLEIIRHTLHRYGVSTIEIQYLLNSMRQTYYATAEARH